VPFPIFSKVQNNTLKLDHYHLNDGYSRAMERFFRTQTSYESLIDALVLHANNLTDDSFTAILQGLSKHSRLRHLHYGMNELGEKSNEALLVLLEVQFPKQLKSLVLTNLKLTAKAGIKVVEDIKVKSAEDSIDHEGSDEE